MDPDGVDFVVTSSSDGRDEDIPEPPRREWSGRTRIGAGIVALAAVAGIVVATTRPGTPTAAPATIPTPTAPSLTGPSLSAPTSTAPTFTGPSLTVPIGSAPGGRLHLVPRASPFDRPDDVIGLDPATGAAPCPQAGDGQAACQSSRRVPAGVRAAVRAHFPGARVVTELDQSLRDVGLGPGGLWYRRVTATAGALRITVVVRKPLPEDGTSGLTQSVGGRDVIFQTTGNGGFTVSVTVSAPIQHPNLSGAVDLLVSDQRLLAAS